MAKRDGAVALGETLAPAVGDQVVVVVARRRDAEERLQQPMQMSGVEEVLAAADQGDPLQVIVQDDGQVIAGRRVLAGEDRVAQRFRPRLDPAGPAVVPVERAGARHGAGDVETPGERLALDDSPLALGRIDVAADARVDELVRRAMRRSPRLLDLHADLLA